jgi:protein-disulfide isomerase
MPNTQSSDYESSEDREHREAARRDRRLAAARTSTPTPPWQSPIVLITLGAVAIGLVVVLAASGVLGAKDGGSSADLLVPIRPTPAELTDPSNPRALGTASAPITIDVWSDFQCPACGLFAKSIEPDLISEFVKPGTVRLVYRDMAFIDGGDLNGESHQAGAAARCAGDQGKFWQYHDYVFENQNGENKGWFSPDRLAKVAQAVGLDVSKYGSCMAGDAPEKAVTVETDQGGAAGVFTTPTLATNGVLQMPGALSMDQVRTLVAAELAKVSPAPAISASPTARP